MKVLNDAQLRRRIFFVSGNLAVCGVIIVGLVLPLHAFFAERDAHIADQRQMLARLQAIAAQAQNVSAIVSDTTAQLQGGEFLAGPNENVISADLQNRLKAIAEGAGARSRATQALPQKAIGQIKYSGSRIEIYGPLQSIQRAVYAIESAKPYLFIMGASIKTASPASRPGLSEEPTIQAQLDVFGAMQSRGAER
jgi:general secretion pathway protein M